MRIPRVANSISVLGRREYPLRRLTRLHAGPTPRGHPLARCILIAPCRRVSCYARRRLRGYSHLPYTDPDCNGGSRHARVVCERGSCELQACSLPPCRSRAAAERVPMTSALGSRDGLGGGSEGGSGGAASRVARDSRHGAVRISRRGSMRVSEGPRSRSPLRLTGEHDPTRGWHRGSDMPSDSLSTPTSPD